MRTCVDSWVHQTIGVQVGGKPQREDVWFLDTRYRTAVLHQKEAWEVVTAKMRNIFSQVGQLIVLCIGIFLCGLLHDVLGCDVTEYVRQAADLRLLPLSTHGNDVSRAKRNAPKTPKHMCAVQLVRASQRGRRLRMYCPDKLSDHHINLYAHILASLVCPSRERGRSRS